MPTFSSSSNSFKNPPVLLKRNINPPRDTYEPCYANIWLTCDLHPLSVCGHVRCESFVLLCADVVRVEVEHPDHEGHEHHDEDDHELEDVLHCSPERYLQGPEAFVGW